MQNLPCNPFYHLGKHVVHLDPPWSLYEKTTALCSRAAIKGLPKFRAHLGVPVVVVEIWPRQPAPVLPQPGRSLGLNGVAPDTTLRFRNIALTTRFKATMLALRRPRQQSSESYNKPSYKIVQTLRRDGNDMTMLRNGLGLNLQRYVSYHVCAVESWLAPVDIYEHLRSRSAVGASMTLSHQLRRTYVNRVRKGSRINSVRLMLL